MKALGTDDSINACDCCGKTGLKFTVIVELDDGDIAHYGSTCATRNTGKTSKVINAEIRTEQARVREAIAAAERAHPACAAYAAKLSEAHRAGIRPGREFMAYVNTEAEADRAARAAIALSFAR